MKQTFLSKLLWAARLISAVILLQTLYFKFTGSIESVFLFSLLGMEPAGRIGIGILELIASVMLLITPLAFFGASLAICLMIGAVYFHLTIIGIEVRNDNGLLFSLALLVLLCCTFIVYMKKDQAVAWVRALIPSKKNDNPPFQNEN